MERLFAGSFRLHKSANSRIWREKIKGFRLRVVEHGKGVALHRHTLPSNEEIKVKKANGCGNDG